MNPAHTMPTMKNLRRLTLFAVLSVWSAAHAQTVVDLSPEQKGRLRAPKDEAAIATLSKDFKFVYLNFIFLTCTFTFYQSSKNRNRSSSRDSF